MVSILFCHPGKIQVSTGRRRVGRRPGSKAKKGQKTPSVGCVKGPSVLGELKAFSGSHFLSSQASIKACNGIYMEIDRIFERLTEIMTSDLIKYFRCRTRFRLGCIHFS